MSLLNNRYNQKMDVSKLIEYCRMHGITLAIAESCTGGHVADLITDIAGASAVFLSGLVAYSRDAKVGMLGVPTTLLEKHGLVSREAAIAMADCMRLLAHADYAIATTGNLGPAVLEGKPCGLVHIAVSSAERVYSRELHLGGDRAGNKQDASLAALQLLAEALHEEKSYDEHAV